MALHKKHKLTTVINARGVYTPLGEFFIISELQDVASRQIANSTGAETGAITHCTAASITLGVAATMTGSSAHTI